MTLSNIYDLIGTTVFARWSDGYYYPAVIDTVGDFDVKVSYLDGDTGTVQRKHIVPLDEALRTFSLQGNWQNHGIFFRGSVSGDDPMIMYYRDGDVEEVQLVQLRGTRPGEKPISRRVLGVAVAVVAVGAVIFGVSRIR